MEGSLSKLEKVLLFLAIFIFVLFSIVIISTWKDVNQLMRIVYISIGTADLLVITVVLVMSAKKYTKAKIERS